MKHAIIALSVAFLALISPAFAAIPAGFAAPDHAAFPASMHLPSAGSVGFSLSTDATIYWGTVYYLDDGQWRQAQLPGTSVAGTNWRSGPATGTLSIPVSSLLNEENLIILFYACDQTLAGWSCSADADDNPAWEFIEISLTQGPVLPPPPGEVGAACGNGICESGETTGNCATDCDTAACSDSDGARTFHVKGTTTGIWQPTGQLWERTDYCIPSGALVEIECKEDAERYLTYTVYQCPNGCDDGACNPSSGVCGDGKCDTGENTGNCAADCSVQGCTDTDDGIDYYQKGYATGTLYDGSHRLDLPEECMMEGGRMRLAEWSCHESGILALDYYDCPNGCSDGACQLDMWATYRHDYQRTDVAGSDGPQEGNLLWKASAEIIGTDGENKNYHDILAADSDRVYAHGTHWIGTYNENDLIAAFDAKTGEKLWEYEMPDATNLGVDQDINIKYAILSDGLLYVTGELMNLAYDEISHGGGFVVLDAETGEVVRFMYNTDFNYLNVPWYTGSNVIIDDGVIYYYAKEGIYQDGTYTRHLVAVDAATSEIKWTKNLDLDTVSGGMSLYNGIIYMSGSIEAPDARYGRKSAILGTDKNGNYVLEKTYEYEEARLSGPLIIDNGNFYSYGSVTDSRQLLKLDSSDGSVMEVFDFRASTPTPIVDSSSQQVSVWYTAGETDGLKIYNSGVAGNSNAYYGVDKATGKIRFMASKNDYNRGDQLAVAKDGVYFTSRRTLPDGSSGWDIMALDVSTGVLKWEMKAETRAEYGKEARIIVDGIMHTAYDTGSPGDDSFIAAIGSAE